MRRWIWWLLLASPLAAQEGDQASVERVFRRPEFVWKQGKQPPPPMCRARRVSQMTAPAGAGRLVPDRTGQGVAYPLPAGVKGNDNLDPDPHPEPEGTPDPYASKELGTPSPPGKPNGSATPSPSGRPNASATPSVAGKPNAAATPSPSGKPNASATPSPPGKPKGSATPSLPGKPNASGRPTPSGKPNASATPSVAGKPSASPTPSPYGKPTATPSPSGSPAASPTASTPSQPKASSTGPGESKVPATPKDDQPGLRHGPPPMEYPDEAGILERVAEFWNKLLKRPPRPGQSLQLSLLFLRDMVLLMLLLVGVGQGLRWLWQFVRWRRPRRSQTRLAVLPSGELDLEPEVIPEWQVLWRLAQSQRDQRAAYLALLAYLDDAGHIRYRPGCTNREYWGELVDQPQLRQAFQSLTRQFDRCRYGGAPPDFELFQLGCREIFPS